MTAIHIDNVLCHEDVTLELSDESPILITGKNAVGKTSMAAALAAVASMNGNPYGLSKTEKKSYLRDGAAEGSVEMDGVVWRPPNEVEAPADAKPKAIPHTVGLVDFVRKRQDRKDRAGIWEGLFMPQDPEKVLAKAPLPPEILAKTIEHIKESGWEPTLLIYENRRKEKKRQWAGITGKQWGSAVGPSWLPEEGWDTELEGEAEESLQTAVVDARDRVQQHTVSQAVSQERVDAAIKVRDEELPAARAALEDLMEADGKLSANVRGIEADLKVITDELDKLKADYKAAKQKIGTRHWMKCPECNAEVRHDDGKLIARAADTELLKEVEAAENVMARVTTRGPELKKEMTTLQDTLRLARGAQSESHSKVNRQEGMVVALEARAKDASLKPTDQDDSEVVHKKLLRDVQDAEMRLVAFQQWNRAKALHEEIVDLDGVVKLLGPDGLRETEMRVSMARVRKALETVSKVTGWKPIAITQDYQITVGGRAVQTCSESERLKAQWAMQSVCYMLSRSTWLILDRCDTVKDESQDGLIELANRLHAKKGGHIVLCATSQEAPPNWQAHTLS